MVFFVGQAQKGLVLGVGDPLHRLLDGGSVLFMRNLRHDPTMAALFASCSDHMVKGQTYTNDKIAILIPDAKLQRENFTLWL